MLGGSPASEALAATVSLPDEGVGYLAVDDAHQHVFVTGDPSTSTGVTVLDFDGQVVATIDEPGASGVAIDAGTLYVAACENSQIDEFSTSTLAKVGSISTTRAMRWPCDLAAAGGRLWFDMPTASFPISQPTSVTIAEPHTEYQWMNPSDPVYTLNPADSNSLLMRGTYGAPNYQQVWDIAASPPTKVAYLWAEVQSDQFDRAAVSADGSHVYLVVGSVVRRWFLPALNDYDETLQAGPGQSPTSVTVSADGSLIAVGTYDAAKQRGGVEIFADGQTTPQRSLSWDGTGMPFRVRFSADGTRLFVVTDRSHANSPAFEVVTEANLAGSQLDLSPSPDTVPPGSPTNLSGTLQMQDGASAANKTISLTLTQPDTTTTTLASTTTDAAGHFQVTTPALSQLGDHQVTASYAGDAGHAPSQMASTVHVTKIISSLTLQATPSTLAPGDDSTLSGTLSFADQSSPAGIQVSLSGLAPDTTPIDLGTTVTDANGSFTVPTGELQQLGSYHLTASYAGSATRAPTQATTTIAVAKLQTTLTIASKETVIYGQAVVLTARLSGGQPGLPVTITTTINNVATTVASGVLDSNLSFAATIHPGRNLYYIAHFAGDDRHLASQSVQRLVRVAPVITASLPGYYAKSGVYRLFHYHAACASRGVSCPMFSEHMIPNHAGRYVDAVLEQHTAKGWKHILTWRHQLTRTSTTSFKVRYLNTHVIGHSYRLIAVFNGDSDHAPIAWGAWYFRVNR